MSSAVRSTIWATRWQSDRATPEGSGRDSAPSLVYPRPLALDGDCFTQNVGTSLGCATKHDLPAPGLRVPRGRGGFGSFDARSGTSGT